MEEKISFEKFLFGDEPEIILNDVEFCVDRIVLLPQLHPHKLEKAVQLACFYCNQPDFRRKLLEKSIDCHVLMYRLYKRGIFVFDEIEPFLRSESSFLLCHYFRKEIVDFESFILKKWKPYDINESFFVNDHVIDSCIEYGFPPSSIEFCLKYDDINVFQEMNIMKLKYGEWSPFEWSMKPQYLDLLSISGFFGSIKCFKFLLMNGFEINEKSTLMVVCGGCLDLFHLSQGLKNSNIESFCKASEFCHESLLAFMFENGFDVNVKDGSKNTPLHYAADKGHLSVVEFLVNHGADANVKNDNGLSPFHLSAKKAHLNVVEFLFNHGANISQEFEDDTTQLHVSSQNGHLNIVMFLVQNGADINKNCYRYGTPLICSVIGGHLCIVEYLISQGADVSIEGISGSVRNPIFYAAEGGDLRIVQCLVNNGAEINRKYDNFSPPLFNAASHGHLSVVKFLVNQGANLGFNYLNNAVVNGHLNVVEYLVNQGVDINGGDYNGNTPLTEAIMNCKLSVVEWLVNHGAYFSSGLLCAAMAGRLDIAEYLINNGASISPYDELKRSPLHCSAIDGTLCVFDYLVKQGLDINQEDINDNMLYFYGLLFILPLKKATLQLSNIRFLLEQTSMQRIGVFAFDIFMDSSSLFSLLWAS